MKLRIILLKATIYGWLSTIIGSEYISDMFTNTVEIIEEPKEIEKLELCMEYDYEEVNDNLEKDMKTLVFKINELKENK